MKLTYALLLASSLAFMACGDDDDDSPASPSKAESSASKDKSSDSKAEYDCTVENGTKILYPAGGEKFHIGDKITVVYASDLDDSGYVLEFKKDKDSKGKSLVDGSIGVDGKAESGKCYEEEITLSAEVVEASENAIIRIRPYTNTSKGANSGEFTVVE